MLRQLTNLERKTALLLVEAGEQARWEYSASLVCPQGPLLEFSTEMLDFQANPSSTLLHLISKWPDFVLHHNHLSGESLSSGDWRGASLYFKEIFAHCNDGTLYYGRVLNSEKDLPLLFSNLEVKAENYLFEYTGNPGVDEFFRKEVINRAFRIKEYVEYEYSWGNLSTPHPNVVKMKLNGIQTIGGLGRVYDTIINNAANTLSKDI
ncbi:hypothetical protein DFO55_12212 [Grimontella sp. AG753]|nr:hypothetical protein DFO55_12212 [Grimontella sp. AG753]